MLDIIFVYLVNPVKEVMAELLPILLHRSKFFLKFLFGTLK